MMATNNDAEAIRQSSLTNSTATIARDSGVVSSPLPNDGDKSSRIAPKDQNSTTASTHIVYNPKKPKWWGRLGNNGRDATKSQKRAMRKVLDGKTSNVTNLSSESTTRTGLRLPTIPYGAKLDWDEIFPGSSEGDRDIWLELGFGRGENLQALLESKLWEEGRQERARNSTNHGDGNKNDTVGAGTAHVDINVSSQTEIKKFYLVGAEVSGVGIGCLCKRIEQLQEEKQTTDPYDDHYSLYFPEMDPYSSREGGDGIASECKEKADDFVKTGGGQIPWIEERNEFAAIYSDRLRIHTGDGYKLLPKLPNGSLSAILITFPDPFPKETDVNYRLVQHQTLIECHRILRKGNSCNENNKIGSGTHNSNGRLFLATDHDGYHEWCHKIMHEVNRNNQYGSSPLSPLLFEMEEPCPDRMKWLPAVSRYEQKGWDEGRSTKLTCWVAR